MDWPANRRYRQSNYDILDYGREPSLELDRTSDATGYWFLAAVLFAFLAAGVIVYRASNANSQTAANYSSNPTALSDPIAPAGVLGR